MRVEMVPLREAARWPRNPKLHDLEGIKDSLRRHGIVELPARDGATGRLVAGHGRLEALEAMRDAGEPPPARVAALRDGDWAMPVLLGATFPTEAEAEAYLVGSNRLTEKGGWDSEALGAMLQRIKASEPDLLRLAGYSDQDLRRLLGETAPAPTGPSMVERFGVPPFSVLDARQGYWQERKRKWIDLGIRSELGRGGDLVYDLPEWAERGGKAGVKGGAAPGGSKMPGKKLANGKFSREDIRAKGSRPRQTASLKGGLTHGTTIHPYDGQDGGEASRTGTSIFDPVLTELAVRWFSPPGGRILDPFAGGSVRGIVAAALGRHYSGIELRAEQVAANRQQWGEIGPRLRALPVRAPEPAQDATPDLTPVERRGEFWFKRDDAFTVAGVRGGKVRTCWGLAQGATGLVTAGSRASPQVNIVAHIAQRLGIPCRVHTPKGKPSPEVEAAVRCGAERVEHGAGYNNVIIARAREDAAARGWTEIPFGMECQAAVDATRSQVANLPNAASRLVVPVGSGMSLAGILWGLRDAGRSLPVLGVVVGADPAKRLDRWAPPGWRDMVELVESGLDYHDDAEQTELEGLGLDPVYEAKCIPFLKPGDCFWCVGLRQSASEPVCTEPVAPAWHEGDSTDAAKLVEGQFDLVFSCPPYADLEVYSDDPRDLSTMGYEVFLPAYRRIVSEACALLRPDRFACFVVGDLRGPGGAYRNFVSHTIDAFERAGLRLYNEAILVTAVGSLPIRAGRVFSAARKLGKTHQNVLVFVKGSPERAAAACGEVEVSFPVEAE